MDDSDSERVQRIKMMLQDERDQRKRRAATAYLVNRQIIVGRTPRGIPAGRFAVMGADMTTTTQVIE